MPASTAAWAPRTIRPPCARTARAWPPILTARDVITAHQVHSATAVVVDEAWSLDERPRADAIVTATRGLAVGVLTADCAPVLFADREAGVVAAAHAGWRGASAASLEATLAAMERLGASRERIVPPSVPASASRPTRSGPEFEQEFLERDAGERPVLHAGPSPRRPPALRPSRATWGSACGGGRRRYQSLQPLHLCADRRFLQLSALAGREKSPITAAKSLPSS